MFFFSYLDGAFFFSLRLDSSADHPLAVSAAIEDAPPAEPVWEAFLPRAAPDLLLAPPLLPLLILTREKSLTARVDDAAPTATPATDLWAWALEAPGRRDGSP